MSVPVSEGEFQRRAANGSVVGETMIFGPPGQTQGPSLRPSGSPAPAPTFTWQRNPLLEVISGSAYIAQFPSLRFFRNNEGTGKRSYSDLKDISFNHRPQKYVPPTVRELKDSFYKKYRADIDRCIEEVFGQDYPRHFGNKRRETVANSPAVNVNRSRRQLGRMTGVPAAEGSADNRVGRNGLVYISREAWRDPINALGVGDNLYRTYAHELANVLSYRIALSFTAYGDPKGIGTTFQDKDTGAKFEKCIFGNVNF